MKSLWTTLLLFSYFRRTKTNYCSTPIYHPVNSYFTNTFIIYFSFTTHKAVFVYNLSSIIPFVYLLMSPVAFPKACLFKLQSFGHSLSNMLRFTPDFQLVFTHQLRMKFIYILFLQLVTCKSEENRNISGQNCIEGHRHRNIWNIGTRSFRMTVKLEWYIAKSITSKVETYQR